MQAGQKEVNQAVAAARAAFPVWSQTPGVVRARHLYAIARNIQKHHRLLAVLESMDNGKPIRESRDIDVPLLARHFYYYAGWAQLMETELRDYQPVGVIGQIIPWNFPLLMLGWKIAPAIATGNTVVLKPASYTRLSALLFAEIVAEAGLPPGVVNVITGSSAAGSMIVTHPDVDKIAFTGSTDVGRTLRRQTAGSGQEAVAGARRQIAVRGLRGCGPGRRRRGRGRRHLVQPGPGLLRGLAPAGPGERRRELHRQAQDGAWSTCGSAIRSTSASTWAPSSTRPSGTRSISG